MTHVSIDMTLNKVNLPNDTYFNRHDDKQVNLPNDTYFNRHDNK